MDQEAREWCTITKLNKDMRDGEEESEGIYETWKMCFSGEEERKKESVCISLKVRGFEIFISGLRSWVSG